MKKPARPGGPARRGSRPPTAKRAAPSQTSAASRRRPATAPPARASKRPATRPKPRAAGKPRTAQDAKIDGRIRRALFTAWRAAEAKKAQDTLALDVRGLADFTDYFLITEGANARQVEAIAEAIETALEPAPRPPSRHASARGGGPRLAHREGGAETEWRVLDYLDFVVHIFSAPSRRFYALERLWQKAPRLALPAARGPRPAA